MIKHILLPVFIFLLSCFAQETTIVNGLLDLSTLQEGETISITGEADFYWKQHLSLSEIDRTNPSAVISLPSEWNGLVVDSEQISGMGFATIAYKITAPDSLRHNLALSIPTIYSSYRLYIDSVKIVQVGDPQNRRETTINSLSPTIVEFSMESDTAVILFQISNYINNIGGIWQPVTIGEKNTIHRMQEKSLIYDLFILGGLFVFAATSMLSFFLIHNGLRNWMNLYYSIYVSLLFIRVLVSGNFFIYRILPSIPSSIWVHLDYLVFALIPLFFLLYIQELFRDVCNKRVVQIGKFFFISFASISILTPLWIHSKTILIQEICVFSTFLYSFWVANRSYKITPVNSVIVQISIALFLGAVAYDIKHLSDEGFVLTLAPLSGIIMSILNSFILVHEVRLSFVKSSEVTSQLNTINNKFRSFVPNLFFSLLKTTPEAVQLGDHFNKKMTVLFCDIRNLTELSKDLSHEEKFNLITAFIGDITPRVISQNGIVDKFVGDSVMCIFPDAPDSAVTTALEIVCHYNSDSDSEIKVGIGIHFGKMTLGVIGTHDRMESTVIGDAVNTAARMKSLTHSFDVDMIVSSDVIQNGFNKNSSFYLRSLGTLAVKGKRQRTTIEEIFYSPEGVVSPKLDTRAIFEQAMIYYEAKKFIRAGQFFQRVLEINPDDKAAIAFLTSCEIGGGSLLKGGQ